MCIWYSVTSQLVLKSFKQFFQVIISGEAQAPCPAPKIRPKHATVLIDVVDNRRCCQTVRWCVGDLIRIGTHRPHPAERISYTTLLAIQASHALDGYTHNSAPVSASPFTA